MFTGLIRGIGKITALLSAGQGRRLEIYTDANLGEIRDGDSVAVDGVCLTVSDRNESRFRFMVSPETVAKTTVGSYRPGRLVNLEPALRLGDPVGGHLVSGHVDGVTTVTRVIRKGLFVDVEITAPAFLKSWIVPKGSVALDGVSLTVASLIPHGFRVSVIPETVRRTTVGSWRSGQRVNVEIDRGLKTRPTDGLDRGFLAGHGFS